MKEFIVIAVALALIVLGPFVTIWAMNTLFPALAIPYTIDTWCAVIILKGFAAATVTRK